MAPAVDIAPIAGGIIGGMVLMICVILFLLFLKIVYHLCLHQRLSSGRDDVIEMTDNIVYQSSAGVSGLHTESTEVVDHSYEKLSCESGERTMAVGRRIDHDQVNGNLYPKGVNENAMDGKEIDDDYYYRIDVFIKCDKEDKMKNSVVKQQ